MNEGLDPVKVQGLAEADHRPEMEDLFFLGFRHEARDQGHRDRTEMTYPLKSFFPVHDRHGRIKKDQVVVIVLDLPETVLAAQRAVDLMAFLLEGLTELLTDQFLVIDDQKLNDRSPRLRSGTGRYSKPGNLKFSRSVSR